MPRRRIPRRVEFFPEVTYFKPLGMPLSHLEEVILENDEVEALRLADFEGKEQTVAAEKMGISQSTFQRILTKARKKVTEGLILGKAIILKGGEEEMVFGRGRGFGRGAGRGAGGRGRMGGFGAGPGGVCVCTNPECGYEAPHQAGVPCYTQKCPKCGSPMIRKR
ncbi:DUF134 domain-containing protein [bacterium]|nr:DUF134 domain-containing protein [bacterium]